MTCVVFNIGILTEYSIPIQITYVRWLSKQTYQNTYLNYLGQVVTQANLLEYLVATLALGSQPKQRVGKLQAKREARESCRMLLGVQENVREQTLTLPRELPHWELESRWTPEFSKGNCRGQNSMAQKVLYIIGKLLQRRCPKWACITHLNI